MRKKKKETGQARDENIVDFMIMNIIFSFFSKFMADEFWLKKERNYYLIIKIWFMREDKKKFVYNFVYRWQCGNMVKDMALLNYKK